MSTDQRRRRRRSIIVNGCKCGHCVTCQTYARQAARRLQDKVLAGLRPADRARPAALRPVELNAFDRLREATAPLLLRRPS